MTDIVDLAPTEAANRFSLALTPQVCVGPPESRHMFGGVGLAAAMLAMERASGRSIIWASAHYLSPCPCDESLDLETEVLVDGRHTSQVAVVARLGDRIMFRASGALGARPGEISGQWAMMPQVDGPDSCPAGLHWRGDAAGVHSRLDVRIAKGRYGRDRIGAPEADGRLLLWVRPRSPAPIDAAFLAIVSDLLPVAVGNALGMNAGGNSLDNTLRVVRVVPTEWVLAEFLVQGLQGGFAHGAVQLFAESGDLLAVASQSLIMRLRTVT